MDKELKVKTIKGLSWSFAEKFLTQGMYFAIGLILTRILAPDDYGNAAIAAIFVTFASSLIKGGISEALIRKKDADESYFTTAAYALTGIAFLFLFVLYVIAPWISKVYKIPELCSMLRFYALILPMSALNEIQIAKFRKNMEFKKLFWASFPGSIAGGIAGVIAAINGGGAWAIIIFFMGDILVDTLIMSLQGGISFKYPYSHNKFIELWSFGSKSMADNMINYYSEKVSDMLFAAFKSPDIVAFHNRGKQYPYVIYMNTGEVINGALFPVMSKFQDDRDEIVEVSMQSIKMTTFVMFPMMAGFGAVGEPLFSVVLTDKWLPAVPFLYLACIRHFLQPYISCSERILKVRGKVGQVLRTQVMSRLILLVSLPFVFKLEAIVYAWIWVVVWVIWMIFLGYYAYREVGYGIIKQFKDTLCNLICTALMLVAVIFSGYLVNSSMKKLLVQIFAGIVTYVFASAVTRNDSYIHILEMIKNYLKGRKQNA